VRLETVRLLLRRWVHDDAERLLDIQSRVEVVAWLGDGEPAVLVPLPDNEHGEVEIGWPLHPDCWGHGYASEAATAVLAHGFAGGLPEILAVSPPTTTGPRR